MATAVLAGTADGNAALGAAVSSLKSEATFATRTGRAPTDEEVAAYLERHQLEAFLTQVIMHVARHLPADPYAFLVDHVEALVVEHRARCGPPGGAPAPAPAWMPGAAESEDAEGGAGPARHAQVLHHVAAALRSDGTARASATGLFDRFATSAEGEAQLTEDGFKQLCKWLGERWHFSGGDMRLMVQALARWRFQGRALPGRRGWSAWPMPRQQFLEAFPRLLRRVRDRYAPAGSRDGGEHAHQGVVITDRYAVGPRFGRGAFGDVLAATLRTDRVERRICQRVPRPLQAVPCEELEHEIALLRALDHPHIVRVRDCFESEDWLDFVADPPGGVPLARLLGELRGGGPPAPWAARPEALAEDFVAALASQVLDALAYAHDTVGVIHKDVSPDAVFLAGEPGASAANLLREPAHALLADFGLAELLAPLAARAPHGRAGGRGAFAAEPAGGRSGPLCDGGARALAYASPETIAGAFSEKSDVWSLGAVVFELLLGDVPFPSGTARTQANAVCDPRRRPPWRRLEGLGWSPGARHFCQRLLVKEEAGRPSAAAAAQDAWAAGAAAQAAAAGEAPGADPRRHLGQRHLQARLAQAASAGLVSHLSLARLHQLRLRFGRCQALGRVEVQGALEDVGLPAGEVARLVAEALGADGGGGTEYHEFAAGCVALATEGLREQLRAAFEVFDAGGSGALAPAALARLLAGGADGVMSTSAAPRRAAEGGHTFGTDAILRLSTILPEGHTVEGMLCALPADQVEQVTLSGFEAYLLAEHERVGREFDRKHALVEKALLAP